MKADHTPEFTFTETPGTGAIWITHKSGARAQLHKREESYLASNLTGADNLTAKRKLGMLKAMEDWYYHTQIKKKD